VKLWNEQTVTIAGTLGVAALFFVGIYLPQQRKLNHVALQVQQQRLQLSEAQRQYSQLTALNQRVEQLRARVADLNDRLSHPARLGGVLEQIVEKLNSARLATQEIRPQSPRIRDRYSELPVILSFRGSFADVCDFLISLENMHRLIKIKEVRLEAGGASAAPVIKANMVLNIYCSRS